MTVGRSDSRTPGKHALLNKVLGREAGALANTPRGRHPWVIIDLCAGDGRPDDASGTSSPQIMTHHARWPREHGCEVVAIFLERQRSTFDTLKANVVPHPGNRVHWADSRDAGVIPTEWQPGSAVFVHNDPNTISDFALADDLVRRLPKFTTTLSTLGCNVGGLKRLDPSERRRWFAHVERVISLMADHHDALLIALNGDDSQWAYLLTGPKVWRDRYDRDVDVAFARWTKGVTSAWFKGDRAMFNVMCRELFLTRAEKSPG